MVVEVGAAVGFMLVFAFCKCELCAGVAVVEEDVDVVVPDEAVVVEEPDVDDEAAAACGLLEDAVVDEVVVLADFDFGACGDCANDAEKNSAANTAVKLMVFIGFLI